MKGKNENVTQGQQLAAAAQPAQTTQPTQPAQVAQPTQPTTSRRSLGLPRMRGSTYDKVVHKGGLLVATVLTLGLWWVGASFTLQWLASMGIDINSPYLWLVPIGITFLEIGLQRSKHPVQVTIWLVVLAFDCYTTAVGLHYVTRHQHGISMPMFEYATLTGGIGFLLALSPEHIARSIVQEFKR